MLPDWIQDAIVERNRRLRTTRKLHSSYIGHGTRWEVAWAWIWSRLSIFADAAQSWFVVSLVGEQCLLPTVSQSLMLIDSSLLCVDGTLLSTCVVQHGRRSLGICIGVNAALISIITAWLSDLKMGCCYDGWWLNRQFCCWEIENDEAGCESWHRWSTVLPVRWTVYVIFAVSAMSILVPFNSA